MSAIINDAKYQLEILPLVFNHHGIVFSKTIAAKLVGGRGKLYKLIKRGDVRVEKKAPKQNGKWYCNGGDVIRNIKL